ncbi:MAG: metallopeptidase family protein [Firmicutes bacterium]|nr:metallopeptidase family protein [Bacillota bacterium]MBR6700339.1 metallopeptidase family protein [Bacillota bacterium]
MTIDEAQVILEELVNDLPERIFKELNGGVLLLPKKKISPEAKKDDLYIMGEYCVSPNMGRLVKIYYGSMEAVLGENASNRKWTKELRKTLHHELTHHLEDLAGENDLVIEDEINMYLYKNGLPMGSVKSPKLGRYRYVNENKETK